MKSEDNSKITTEDIMRKRISDLEIQAADFREAANKRAKVAADMEAKRESVNGKITLKMVNRLGTFSDAGGHRSAEFYESPPYVQDEVNTFEDWTASNIYQVVSLIYTKLAHGEAAWCSEWWQNEIDRNKTIARTLNDKAQEAQAEADRLKTKLFGSTQPSWPLPR